MREGKVVALVVYLVVLDVPRVVRRRPTAAATHLRGGTPGAAAATHLRGALGTLVDARRLFLEAHVQHTSLSLQTWAGAVPINALD